MPESEPRYALADGRSLLSVDGPDARPFLQGIVSNDVGKLGPARAIWAAFLTPQGKYLHDFFIAQIGDALVFDCEAARRDDLLARLRRYRLRAKLAIEPDDSRIVALGFDSAALGPLGLPPTPGAARSTEGGIVYVDPRLAAVGARAILPAEDAAPFLEAAGLSRANLAAYDECRIALGLPDGSRDLEVAKSLLIESGFDELNGVDWDKGCYMGQELTARTHYRALIKKRLIPVRVEGAMPAPGTPVTRDGKEIGVVRSGQGRVALALLRLDGLKAEAPLRAGEATLTPHKPDWARF
jgi:folate-binding protein YgfZ